MAGWVQSFIDLIAAHPNWAGVLVFLTAMTESIAVIGFFIPGTTILLGVGAVSGLGHLDIWPILFFAVAGAIVGDGVSYWLGYRYKDQIRSSWPFSTRPELLERGEAFFHKRGAMGVFVGRFVPAIRAIVPMVAGILGMKPARFYTANVVSAVVWAPAHILPGALVGLSLDILGAFAGRIVILLAAVLLLLGLIGWLIRLAILWAVPPVARWQRRVFERLHGRSGWPARTLAAVLDPDDPGIPAVLAFGGILIFAVVGLGVLIGHVILGPQLVRLDSAVHTLVQQFHTPALDRIMVAITGLADGVVVGAVMVAAAAWLLWRGAYRRAAGLGAIIILTALFVPVFRSAFAVMRPLRLDDGSESFTLLGSHATFAMALYTSLAWMIATNSSRFVRAAALALGALLIVAIAVSRIYLGAHWPSDVMAGLLFGAALGTVHGLVFRRAGIRRIKPLGLAAVVVIVLAGVGWWHVSTVAPEILQRARPERVVSTLDEAAWTKDGWQAFGGRRIELDGSYAEPLSIQFAGAPAALAAALAPEGWLADAPHSIAAFGGYASASTPLAVLPSLVLTHGGKVPALTLVHATDAPDRRLVLRLWPTDTLIASGGGAAPLHVGSLTRETVRRLRLVSTARDRGPEPGDMAGVQARLVADPSLSSTPVADGDQAVLLSRPLADVRPR